MDETSQKIIDATMALVRDKMCIRDSCVACVLYQ